MAKIILTNGVVNVDETYEEILNIERKNGGDWVEFTENDQQKKHIDAMLKRESNYKILININHIQCIKP